MFHSASSFLNLLFLWCLYRLYLFKLAVFFIHPVFDSVKITMKKKKIVEHVKKQQHCNMSHMSWRLWDMLPFNFEALRIDHISWSSVLSTWDSWDQTLSHLASPWKDLVTVYTFRYFRYVQRFNEVCCRSPPSRRWRWMRCHGVTTQRETVRKREKDTIFCETYENWNGFLRKFSHNLQLFHIVSSFVAEFSSGGSVLVTQFSSFTTCLHTSHCHTIVQMLIINLFFFKAKLYQTCVTSIGSVQVAGSIAVSSLQRAKHWLHAVALQGAPKIVREIASMTSVWICWFVWWDV